MWRRFILRACVPIVVALTAVGIMAVGQQTAPESAVDQQVFVSGGRQSAVPIWTPWPSSPIDWVVRGQAGAVAKGQMRTDVTGTGQLKFAVPDVRAAVHLALTLAPRDEPDKAQTLGVVALPADPLADFRQTLGKLDIGLLPGESLTPAVARSRLRHARLDEAGPRGAFKGGVVVLDGLLAGDVDATRAWIDSLPAGTCLIVTANQARPEKSALRVAAHLGQHRPAESTQVFLDGQARIWAGMPADWLAVSACPSRKLIEPKGIVFLQMLAGHVAPDGAVYPLAMTAADAAGRHWLIWNLPKPPTPADPRWDLLLRNSLLWAHNQIHPAVKRN